MSTNSTAWTIFCVSYFPYGLLLFLFLFLLHRNLPVEEGDNKQVRGAQSHPPAEWTLPLPDPLTGVNQFMAAQTPEMGSVRKDEKLSFRETG